MEGFMGILRMMAILACIAIASVTAAQARTFEYCEDASGETLSLLVKVFDEMLHDPETTPLERKSIIYQIERLQGCQVYQDYVAFCRTLKDECGNGETK